MSLRDQINQLLADRTPGTDLTEAIDDVLDAGLLPGFDHSTIARALLHYADSSPLEVADELAGFLTEHSEVPIDGLQLEEFQTGGFTAEADEAHELISVPDYADEPELVDLDGDELDVDLDDDPIEHIGLDAHLELEELES